MTTDFRALCVDLARVADALDGRTPLTSNQGQALDGYSALAEFRHVADRARAALADGPAVPDGREPASVTGQPSDEELLETLDKATATFPPRHPEAEGLNAVEYPLALELRKARAVLARWGNPAPQPLAEGEVEELVVDELVKRLRTKAATEKANRCHYSAIMLTRAADLLQHLSPPQPPAEGEVEELVTLLAIGTDCSGGARLSSNQCRRAAELLQQKPRLDYDRVQEIATEAQIRSAAQYLIKKQHCDGDLIPAIKYAIARWGNPVPQPVPVSERLPRAEDCDAEGRCWWWRTDDADEWWELLCISDAREYNAGCGNARYTHWLPAHALPLPGQEVAR